MPIMIVFIDRDGTIGGDGHDSDSKSDFKKRL